MLQRFKTDTIFEKQVESREIMSKLDVIEIFVSIDDSIKAVEDYILSDFRKFQKL